MKSGKLIIISAPSGSGKSSIIGKIIKDEALKLEFSISATTRCPRKGEEDGKHYYFLSVEEFKNRIKDNQFAEYEEVYAGRFYGTLKSEIERINKNGKNVILDLDVQGGINVKKMYGEHATSIYIKAPSIEELRHRLYSRGTDTIEEIEKRVSKAEYELTFANKFDHIVVNDELSHAIEEVHTIIEQFIS